MSLYVEISVTVEELKCCKIVILDYIVSNFKQIFHFSKEHPHKPSRFQENFERKTQVYVPTKLLDVKVIRVFKRTGK